MAGPKNPEKDSDTAARKKLGDFLEGARKFLDDVHRSVTSPASRLAEGVKAALSGLWRDAEAKLRGVIHSQRIGNPKLRRNVLACNSKKTMVHKIS